MGGLPVLKDGVVDAGVVHLAAQGHLGGDGAGLGVVDAVDDVNVDIVGVPVVHVLHIDMLDLGLILCQDEGAAVVHLGIVGGKVRAQLLQLRAIGGQEAGVGQAGLEVGHLGLQGVLQGVVIHGFDAHLGEVGDFAGIVGTGVLDLVQVAHHGGGIVRREDILRGGDEVVGGHLSHGLALVVIPLHALAQMEGPGQAVVADLPGFRQAGNDLAGRVVLHQGVYHVGAHRLIPGGGGGQIVEGGNLASIEGGVGFLSVSHGGGQAAQQHGQTKNDSNYLLHERTSFF